MKRIYGWHKPHLLTLVRKQTQWLRCLRARYLSVPYSSLFWTQRNKQGIV